MLPSCVDSHLSSAALIEGFHDACTSTLSYLVMDPVTRCCALIDTVLGFDPKSGRTDTGAADLLIERLRQLGGTLQWLLETHVHADHLSGAGYIQRQAGGRIAIGARVTEVQRTFAPLFNLKDSLPPDGRQFDHLFADGERFHIGNLGACAMPTPGHTPACMTYLVSGGAGDAAFVGDTIFAPDQGTARCDFPGGDARILFRSIQKILRLPAMTRLFLCHHYGPQSGPESSASFSCTVAEQKLRNIHVRAGVEEDAFVLLRQARDATLGVPALLLPALQMNLRGGRLPDAEGNGVRYFKTPIDTL